MSVNTVNQEVTYISRNTQTDFYKQNFVLYSQLSLPQFNIAQDRSQRGR
jgi:hypothetical protein